MLEGGGIGEAGCNVGELGVRWRARLDGMEWVSSWGTGADGGWVGRVEGGCKDEYRVDGVRTEGIGEGMTMVWDGVEAELERSGEPRGT
jgi:hypothetical protein